MRKAKNIKLIGVFSFIFIIIVSIAGCSGSNSDKFGADITDKKAVEVKNIFTSPEKYLNQTVKLEGKIVRECPSGCWFFLEDKTGTIFVDINPSGLTIPQRVGKKVVVEGELKSRNGRIIIVGGGVEIK